MKKRGLEGTSSEHRRDAVKSQSLARELIRDAAQAVQEGNCAQAIESLDAAAVYMGAAGASGSWTSDRPTRIRNSQLGRQHATVMKKILAGCIRPRIVR